LVCSFSQTFPGAARLTYGTHLESDVNNAETTVAPSAVEEVADEVEAEEVVGSLPQKRSHNELLQKPMKYDVSFGIRSIYNKISSKNRYPFCKSIVQAWLLPYQNSLVFRITMLKPDFSQLLKWVKTSGSLAN
jgi:hypothetical protein